MKGKINVEDIIMNKEFIPYEEALALKELGFDEPCFTIYYKGRKDTLDWTVDAEEERNSELEYDNSCTAPLYQQAFRWFRDEHNIRSYIDQRVLDVDSPNQWQYDYCIKQGNGIDIQPVWSGDFDTYEEAELACIREMIKIVKNN